MVAAFSLLGMDGVGPEGWFVSLFVAVVIVFSLLADA